MMRSAWIVAMLIASGVSSAGAIECPKTLPAKSSLKAPPGWEVVKARTQPTLSGLSIYPGHPSKATRQIQTEGDPEDGFKVDEWKISPDSWLECYYEGTLDTIAKKLPKGLTSCKAYYDPERFYHAGPPERLECK